MFSSGSDRQSHYLSQWRSISLTRTCVTRSLCINSELSFSSKFNFIYIEYVEIPWPISNLGYLRLFSSAHSKAPLPCHNGGWYRSRGSNESDKLTNTEPYVNFTFKPLNIVYDTDLHKMIPHNSVFMHSLSPVVFAITLAMSRSKHIEIRFTVKPLIYDAP